MRYILLALLLLASGASATGPATCYEGSTPSEKVTSNYFDKPYCTCYKGTNQEFANTWFFGTADQDSVDAFSAPGPYEAMKFFYCSEDDCNSPAACLANAAIEPEPVDGHPTSCWYSTLDGPPDFGQHYGEPASNYQCTCYKLECTADDHACTAEQQASGAVIWAYKALPAELVAELQGPGYDAVYMNLFTCGTNNCNSEEACSCNADPTTCEEDEEVVDEEDEEEEDEEEDDDDDAKEKEDIIPGPASRMRVGVVAAVIGAGIAALAAI